MLILALKPVKLLSHLESGGIVLVRDLSWDGLPSGFKSDMSNYPTIKDEHSLI